MKLSDIGVIGLGVMGANLARNIESRGFKVSVFNRPNGQHSSAVEKFKTLKTKIFTRRTISKILSLRFRFRARLS